MGEILIACEGKRLIIFVDFQPVLTFETINELLEIIRIAATFGMITFNYIGSDGSTRPVELRGYGARAVQIEAAKAIAAIDCTE